MPTLRVIAPKPKAKPGILPKITPKPGMIVWKPGKGSYRVPYPKPQGDIITITPQKGGPGGNPDYSKTRVAVGGKLVSGGVKDASVDILKKGGIPSTIKGQTIHYKMPSKWKPTGTEVMTPSGGMTYTPEAFKELKKEIKLAEEIKQRNIERVFKPKMAYTVPTLKERQEYYKEKLKDKYASQYIPTWLSLMSFTDPLGLRSAFTIGHGVIKGQSQREIQQRVVGIRREWLDKNLERGPVKAGLHQAFETGVIAGPIIGGTVPVTSTKTAVWRLGTEGVGRWYQGMHIGRTIKDPNAENLFWAVTPIIAEGGIRLYNKLPSVQRKHIIKEATTYAEQVPYKRSNWLNPRLHQSKGKWYKTVSLPAKEVNKLVKYLEIADDYLDRSPDVNNIKWGDIKSVPSGARQVIQDFIKRKRLIVGGSVAQNTQLRVFKKKPGDVDMYGVGSLRLSKQLVKELNNKGINAYVGRSGDILINGKKALQIHSMQMFYANMENLTPLGRLSKYHNTIVTDNGIRVVKLTTQMRRKLIGAYAENKYRFSKDFPDFWRIVKDLEQQSYKTYRGTPTSGFTSRPGIMARAQFPSYGYVYSGREGGYPLYYFGERKGYDYKYTPRRSYKYGYKQRGYGRGYFTPRGYPITYKHGYPTGYPREYPKKYPTPYPRTYPTSYPKGYPGYTTRPGYTPPTTPFIIETVPSTRQFSKSKEEERGKVKKKKKKKLRWQHIQDPYYHLLGRRKYSRRMNLLLAQRKGNLYV